MFWRKITVIVGGPVLVLLLLALGHQHDLFLTTLWFDMFLHGLGGMTVVFSLAGVLWHLELTGWFDPANQLFRSQISLLGGLLLLSIGWEFLEVWLNMTPNWIQSRQDTVTDMLCALIGGLIALLFIQPARQPEKKLRVPSFENIPK